MFNVQCAMFNVQCAMFNVQCAMCNVQCAMCNVQCSMFNVQCAMCNVTQRGARSSPAPPGRRRAEWPPGAAFIHAALDDMGSVELA